ncbi:MAG TPA: hypothetical protein VGC36_18310, partial [Rhizomicrobium sp.]
TGAAASGVPARMRALNWPLLLAAVLVVYSLTFRVQLGVRMVLPLVAWLAVGAGVGLGRELAANTSPWSKRTLAALIGLGLAFNVHGALTHWPDGLVFVNRFWGGSSQGYRLVSDSNYDWGQGIPELRRWQAEHGPSQLSLWYFGSDPRAAAAPLRILALHDMPLSTRDDVLAALHGRVLAASTTLVYGSGEARGSVAHKQAAALLREQAPFAQVGTFLLYDFRE